jgi:DNA-binding beta-propeller fold protein YncE
MKRTALAAVLLAMAGLTLLGTKMFHPTAAAAPPPSGTTLKQVATIDLPGPAGKRFDYLTIDYDDGYLLSAHLGAGLLYVIDLKTNKVVMTIPDVPGVEGVEYVPELKKIYTSDWHEKKIGVIDLPG